MGGNLFDGVQKTAFNVVTNTMGYDGSWTPSVGGATQTARVLFKNPDEAWGIGNSDTAKDEMEFYPGDCKMEYYTDDFTGLKTAVDDNKIETVVIDSVSYKVRSVRASWDGKTMIAVMKKSS
jgi:hypothetical protein